MKPAYIVAAAFFGLSSFMYNKNVFLNDKELTGAWQYQEDGVEQVIIIIDGYITHTRYREASKEFITTSGGAYAAKDGRLTVNYEFDSKDKERVGTSGNYTFTVNNNVLSTNIGGNENKWKRIDDGAENLAGLWKITARKQGEEIKPIHQTGTRKTIKILSGTRFQWAAIDPGKKEFMGTGGGSYSFKNGKYTEHIEFFSRDSSRVGQSLSFDGKLEKGNWHHSGLSSRGEPIYEIWSRKAQ